MKWLPIETAPKTGEEFIIFEPDFEPTVSLAVFLEFEGEWYLYYADEVLTNECPEGPKPTHWMPMPKPPVDDE